MIPDPHKLATRAARIGMVLCLMLPAGVALLAYAVEASDIIPKWAMAQSEPPVIFFVFGALSISELAVAFLMRKKFFSREHVAAFRNDPNAIDQWLMKSTIIVFALGAMPMIYGAILYVLAGDLRQLAFFGIVTMIGYRLFRPSPEQFEDIFKVTEPTT